MVGEERVGSEAGSASAPLLRPTPEPPTAIAPGTGMDQSPSPHRLAFCLQGRALSSPPATRVAQPRKRRPSSPAQPQPPRRGSAQCPPHTHTQSASSWHSLSCSAEEAQSGLRLLRLLQSFDIPLPNCPLMGTGGERHLLLIRSREWHQQQPRQALSGRGIPGAGGRRPQTWTRDKSARAARGSA